MRVELRTTWEKEALDLGGGIQDRSSRPVLLGRVYGTGRMEDPQKEEVQDECRKRSERYAEKGARGGSLADVRSIGEVEAGTRGADSLQGAKNGFIRERGVGAEGDDEFGVASFSLGEERGELIESNLFRAEKRGTIFGKRKSENRFRIGQRGGNAGGCFGEIHRQLLFHQWSGDHKDNEEDEDQIEQRSDVELGKVVCLGMETGASHERGVKRCSKTAAHSAAKFSIWMFWLRMEVVRKL